MCGRRCALVFLRRFSALLLLLPLLLLLLRFNSEIGVLLCFQFVFKSCIDGLKVWLVFVRVETQRCGMQYIKTGRASARVDWGWLLPTQGACTIGSSL